MCGMYRLVFLGVCLLLFTACMDESRNPQIDADYVTYMTDRIPYDDFDYSTAYLGHMDWTGNNVHARGNISAMGQKLKELAADVQFRKILNIETSMGDPYVLYYKAIANYALMLDKIRHSESQREAFKKEALYLFKKTIYSHSDSNLKAKASLWLGMTYNLGKVSEKGEQKALDLYKKIYTNYPESDVGSDAILYAIQLNSRIGAFEQSEQLLKKLRSSKHADAIVWDPYRKQFYKVQYSAILETKYIARMRF